ncbi:hypothetical protein RAD15_15255 [Bradyrhizobium sp. 14AA]
MSKTTQSRPQDHHDDTADIASSGPREVTSLKDREQFRSALAASDLSRVALKLALQISCHFNGKTGRCDPGLLKLAEEVKIPPRTVERAAAELKKGRWIVVEQNRTDRDANAQIRMFIPTGLPANIVADTPTEAPANIVADSPASDCPPKNARLPAKKRPTARQYGGGTEEQFEQFEQERGEAAARASRVDRDSASNDTFVDAPVPEPPAPVSGALAPTEPDEHQSTSSPPNPSRQSPHRDNPEAPMGRAAHADLDEQFASLKRVYPPSRVGDEEAAFRVFCATIGGRPLLDVMEGVHTVMIESPEVPPLAEALQIAARRQAAQERLH